MVTIGELHSDLIFEDASAKPEGASDVVDEVRIEDLREVVRALLREELDRARRFEADL